MYIILYHIFCFVAFLLAKKTEYKICFFYVTEEGKQKNSNNNQIFDKQKYRTHCVMQATLSLFRQ